jgi:hypothetical protein
MCNLCFFSSLVSNTLPVTFSVFSYLNLQTQTRRSSQIVRKNHPKRQRMETKIQKKEECHVPYVWRTWVSRSISKVELNVCIVSSLSNTQKFHIIHINTLVHLHTVPGEHYVTTKACSHTFHKDCIKPWLERSLDCPFCRTQMIKQHRLLQLISKHKKILK